MRFNRRQKIFGLLVLLWMGVIFWYSSRIGEVSSGQSSAVGLFIGRMLIPGFRDWEAARQLAYADSIDFFVRKSCHAMEYAILASLLMGVCPLGISTGRWMRYAWGMATLYAISDEIHQAFVPGRACMIRDMFIDSTGALIGVCICFVCIWFIGRKNKTQ